MIQSKRLLALAFALVLVPAAGNPLAAWGALGHQMAATGSLRDLPPELAAWFDGQEAALRDHANDPDHWKQSDPTEGPRHFLDCEAYGGAAGVPLDEDAARTRLGDDLFQKSGQVPWTILERVETLSQAFTSGDPGQVAFEAAILCHYVGDISVPLHTSGNYNGDATGQHGVHKRWESDLLKRIVDDEDWVPEVRPAVLGSEPMAAPWAWLKASYQLVPRVLQDDLSAEQASARGEGWGRAYWQVFRPLQEPIVKEELSLSAQRTAQMILLAWNKAGTPVLKRQ